MAIQTLYASPSGLYTLGGPDLRRLRPGEKRWTTLGSVKGGNLYRVAADEMGRVLAAWEGEKVFHLFVPKEKKRWTFPKPEKPAEVRGAYSLDGLFFSQDGADAIVYMQEIPNQGSWIVSGYRVPLDGKSSPSWLFTQAGTRLHTSGRDVLFALRKDPSRPCDSRGCGPYASILAYDISPSGVLTRTLLSGVGDRLSTVRGVGGGSDEELALAVGEKPEARGLLRWRIGEAKAEYKILSKGPVGEPRRSWLCRSGDLVEFWDRGEEYAEKLEIRLGKPGSKNRSLTIGPFPPADIDAPVEPGVYALRERKNGGLLLHWGDQLIFLSPNLEAKRLDLGSLLGDQDEWAGVGIYVPEPEALWIGVEVGSRRDFLRLDLAEAERRALPLT